MGERCFCSAISNVDDVTDNRLELELKSERGCHPKIASLMAEENFRKEAKQHVLENGRMLRVNPTSLYSSLQHG